jgi:heavy metal translocating P-type ATPase
VAGGSAYCCYGCELAAELARESSHNEARLKGTLTLCLLLSMGVMMMSLFLFAEDVYGATEDPSMAKLREIWRMASAILATPVVFLLGVPLLRRAVRSLREGRPGMDLLVGTGATAAWGLSIAAVVRGRAGVYFDSATAGLMLATLGRYLEASARARASGLLGPSLAARGETVEVLAPDGSWRPRPISAVGPGDRLRVPAESALAVDATVVAGPVEVSFGVVSGESKPRAVVAGELLPAGAVPVSGTLECVALRSARDSTVERLAELARTLRERPARAQRLADLFAAGLVPVVFALALGTLGFWASRGEVERGVVAALAVVLAACPCTYGVATPLGLWLALRKALRHGVLIRSAEALEGLAGVNAVALDKTGTLTAPALAVESVELLGSAPRAEVLALASALEEGSPHPVGRAIRALAEAEGVVPAAIGLRRFEPGLGVRGRDADGGELLLGSGRLVGMAGADASLRVTLARGGIPLAGFRIAEPVRSEAKDAVAALRALGVLPTMLTGDAEAGASPVAAALGITHRAGLSPEEKVAALAALGPHAAMVGDGVNDAPALAQARLGFAMDHGSGLSRGMAQATLLLPDLRLVPWTIGLARRTLSLVRRNLVWSTVYNLVFLALAAAGALKPVWAGLSMLASSLLVLISALRIDSLPGPAEKR